MENNDVMLRTLLCGQIRVIAISGGNMVESARQIHTLSRTCTAALGRQLLATVMMTGELKREGECLTTILRGDGPAGNLVCTGRYGGLVKGYVTSPQVELPPNGAGKLDVSGAVGTRGRLTVIRDLSMREPYIGECNLVSGEIAEDFAQYFTVSEQTPSLVYLGVRIDPVSGAVISAGGIIAQPLPGCQDEYIDELQSRVPQITSLSALLAGGASLWDALCSIFDGMEPKNLGETTPQLLCDCSLERTERALIALGQTELTDMITQDNGAELTCHFCNKQYAFNGDALRALLNEAQTE